MLRTLLEGLAARPEVTGAAIVSGDGLLIDHLLPPATDGDAMAALSTTLLRQIAELGAAAQRGDGVTAILEYTGGPVIVGLVPGGAALLVLARDGADLGELLYLVRRHRPAVTDAL